MSGPDGIAHCRLCGVRFRRGEEPVIDARKAGGALIWVKGSDGKPEQVPGEQPWDSRHESCRPEWSWVVEQLVARRVSEQDAEQAVKALEAVPLAGARRVIAKRPFDFVSEPERHRLRTELDHLAWARLPRRHVSGRCGACGRSHSLRWTGGPEPLLWTDGDRAAICTDCRSMWRAAGDGDTEALRTAAVAQVAGLNPGRSIEPNGLRFAAEVLTAEERHDDAEPWTYRPEALAEVRRIARWRHAENIADPAQRARRLAVIAAREAAARREAEAAEARQKPGAAVVW